MSSIPLISHHLFVAAVKDKSCDRQVAGPMGPEAELTEARTKEIQMELIEDGYPVPDERDLSANVLSWTGST
jgi:hypothetical protein